MINYFNQDEYNHVIGTFLKKLANREQVNRAHMDDVNNTISKYYYYYPGRTDYKIKLELPPIPEGN